MLKFRQIFLPAFDAAAIRSKLPEATLLMGVPTFYSRLLQEPGFGKEDCRSMRLFIIIRVAAITMNSPAMFRSSILIRLRYSLYWLVMVSMGIL